MERALIYRRVSDPKQEDGASLEVQQEHCSAVCAARGYEVVEDVVDVHTASELDERPAMRLVRSMMRRKAFDVLVVWKYDRLARKQIHQAVVLYEAKRRGIRVESATQPLDESAVGEFARSAFAFAAELELNNIRERTMEGIRKRVESGKPLVGRVAPYGWQWNADRSALLLNPATAPIVRRMYDMLAHRQSCGEIARVLDAEGVPSPSGGAWLRTTILRIVKNPACWGEAEAFRSHRVRVLSEDEYNGEERAVRRQNPTDATRRVRLPDGVVPAIVSKDVAALALDNLRAAAIHPLSTRISAPENYLLRGGFIHCSGCGRSLSARRRNGRNDYYVCSKTRTGDYGEACPHMSIQVCRIDPAVWEVVAVLLKQPGIIENELREYLVELGADAAEEQTLYERQMAEVTAEQASIAGHIGKFPADSTAAAPLHKRLTELDELAKQLLPELAKAEKRVNRWRASMEGMRRLAEWCSGASRRELTYRDKRMALHALGIQVTLNAYGTVPRFEITSEPFGKLYPPPSLWQEGIGQPASVCKAMASSWPTLPGFVLRLVSTSPVVWKRKIA